MRLRKEWLEKIEKWSFWAAGGFVGLATLLVVFDAVVRKAASSVPGLYETSQLLMLGIVWLAVPRVTSQGRHITMVLLSDRLSPRWRKRVRGLILVVLFAFFGVVLWESSQLAYSAVRMGESSTGLMRFPVWPGRLLVPVAVFILWLRLAVDLIRLRETGERKAGDTSI